MDGSAFVNVENLVGGSDEDTFDFADGARITGHMTGGGGYDTLDYADYTTPVNVNLATSRATGSDGISGFKNYIGGQGTDTLGTPVSGGTINITGPNEGNIGGPGVIDFTSFENLAGAPGVADEFTFDGDASLDGWVDGGFEGFDSLTFNNITASQVIFEISGPDAGRVLIDGKSIRYSGMEPVNFGGGSTVDDVIFDGAGGSEEIHIADDLGNGITVYGDGMEVHNIVVPGISITINGNGGDDVIYVESLDSAFAGILSVNGGGGELSTRRRWAARTR